MFALVALFLAGVIVLAATFGINAEAWVFKRANKHIYSSGQIVAAGTIYDRNGKVLAQTVDGERKYNSSSTVRRATLHTVGDLEGFISTGAHSAFRGELTGYSFLNGVYDLKRNGAGNDITLTIDADLCVTAYNALNGRKGAVGVYNYKTGEILCMVSTPTYDPYYKPTDIDSDTTGKYEAIYLNRFLSGVFTPGSTFKIVTAISAIENIPDINSRTFTCTGQYKTSTGIVKCNSVHGKVNFQQEQILQQHLRLHCRGARQRRADKDRRAGRLQQAHNGRRNKCHQELFYPQGCGQRRPRLGGHRSVSDSCQSLPDAYHDGRYSKRRQRTRTQAPEK